MLLGLVLVACSTPDPDPLPSAPPAPAGGVRTGAPRAAQRVPGAGEPQPPTALRCRGERDLEGCFVEVPRTTYRRGAQALDSAAPNHDPEADPAEGPVREITVGPFWIHRDEASVQLYRRCVESGWCDAGAPATGGAFTWRGVDDPTTKDRPLNGVDRATAAHLCDFLGGRLPTEAEWELAARGTDGRRWPWGGAPGCGVSAERFDPSGTRVGAEMQRPPCRIDGVPPMRLVAGESPLGLRGAGGSLWEWTADGWDPAFYASAPATDPSAPATGPIGVQRGGGWTSVDAADLRTTVRQPVPIDQELVDAGLRCVWGSDAP
jgi:formylglycine-generating enzyme required for sulfatase activity